MQNKLKNQPRGKLYTIRIVMHNLGPERPKGLRNIIEKKIESLLSPKIRFKNQPGEQHTMFIQDPSENVIEIKAFKSSADLFKIK